MSWGWWLPKKSVKTTKEEKFEMSSFDDIFKELEDARYSVEKAIQHLIREDVDETHKAISEAHQHLREASRMLGFRPSERAEQARRRTMLRYYEPLP